MNSNARRVAFCGGIAYRRSTDVHDCAGWRPSIPG